MSEWSKNRKQKKSWQAHWQDRSRSPRDPIRSTSTVSEIDVNQTTTSLDENSSPERGFQGFSPFPDEDVFMSSEESAGTSNATAIQTGRDGASPVLPAPPTSSPIGQPEPVLESVIHTRSGKTYRAKIGPKSKMAPTKKTPPANQNGKASKDNKTKRKSPRNHDGNKKDATPDQGSPSSNPGSPTDQASGSTGSSPPTQQGPPTGDQSEESERRSTHPSTSSTTSSEAAGLAEADEIFAMIGRVHAQLDHWEVAIENKLIQDLEARKTEAEVTLVDLERRRLAIRGEQQQLYVVVEEEMQPVRARFVEAQKRHKNVRQEGRLRARLQTAKTIAREDAKKAPPKAKTGPNQETEIAGAAPNKASPKGDKNVAFNQEKHDKNKKTQLAKFNTETDEIAVELGRVIESADFLRDEFKSGRRFTSTETHQKMDEVRDHDKTRAILEVRYSQAAHTYKSKRPDLEKGFNRLRVQLAAHAGKLQRIQTSFTKQEKRLTSTAKKSGKPRGDPSAFFQTAQETLELSRVPPRPRAGDNNPDSTPEPVFRPLDPRFPPNYSPSDSAQGVKDEREESTSVKSWHDSNKWRRDQLRVKFSLKDHPLEAMRKHGASKPISWSTCLEDGEDDLYYDALVKKEHRDKNVELPTFSGEGEVSFRQFQADFEWAVNRKRSIEWGDKLHYLRKSLKGAPLQSIADCEYSRTGYMYALYILEKDWGGFDKDLHAIQKRFVEQPKVDFVNTTSLRRMRDLLRQIINRMGPMEQPFKSNWEATMFPLIYQVMTEKTKSSWEAYMRREHLKRETVHDLENWLEEVFEYRKNKRMVESISGATRATKTLAFAVDEEGHSKPPTTALDMDEEDEVLATQSPDWEGCLGCHKTSHRLPNCQVFKRKTAWERRDWVTKNRVCYSCLDGQHISKECPRPKQCSICDNNHHVLVHTGARSKTSDTKGPLTETERTLLKKLLSEAEKQANVATGEKETVDNAVIQVEEEVAENAATQVEAPPHTPGNHSHALRTSLGTLFGVVPVWVSASRDFSKAVKVNMTLDTASKKTFTSRWLPEAVGAKTTTQIQRLRTITGTTSHETQRGHYFLRSVDGLTEFETWGSTADLPSGFKPTPPEAIYKAFPHLRDLNLPEPADREGIDVLLGLDNFRMFTSATVETGGPDDPLVRRTPFGLSCMYSYLDSKLPAINLAIDDGEAGDWAEVVEVAAIDEATEEAPPPDWSHIENMLAQSWSNEILGIVPRTVIYTKQWSAAERMAVEAVEASLTRLDNGHYQVGIPWRHGRPRLEFNGAQTQRITAKMEARMAPEVRAGCDKVFQDYADQTFLKPLKADEVLKERKGYFCTWFPVLRPEKTTTKVRPVIHCAQKFGTLHKKSINDEIWAGPKLHNDLLAVLLRFRRKAVVLGGDIKQMYMMYYLPPEDQQFHRIWWRGQPWQFTRLPFGNCAAPFIALHVLQKHIQKYLEEPLRSQVLQGLYVDDLLLSFDTEDEAISARRTITATMAKCGMRVCKWFSNSARVRESIPEGDRAHEVTIGEDTESATLGLKYFPESDHMGVRKPSIEEENITRRTVTSDLCKLYDIMGWVDPVTLSGRRATQELAVLRALRALEWDQDLEKIEDQLVRAAVELWKQYCEGVQGVDEIRVPRRLTTIEGQEEIHVFNDGSKKAIASTAYLRVAGAAGTQVRQICNKRRLNPVEARSIPQIELNAATMGARLGSYLGEILQVEDVKYWTDNICTLYWIRRHARQKDVYVGHRVTEIVTLTSPFEWRHCPTDQNPADLPTRGCTAAILQQTKEWLEGPAFLLLPPEQWPDKPITITEDDVAKLNEVTRGQSREEILAAQVLATWEEDQPADLHVTKRGSLWPMFGSGAAALHPDQDLAAKGAAALAKKWGHLAWTRTSRWIIMIRGLARAIEWIRNRRARTPTSSSLGEAFTILVIVAQQAGFAEELQFWRRQGRFKEKSFLREVNAHFDSKGRLRAFGRAERQTYLTLEGRRPLLIPEDHPI